MAAARDAVIFAHRLAGDLAAGVDVDVLVDDAWVSSWRDADGAARVAIDTLALAAAPDYEAVLLSPVAPLGTNAVVAPTSPAVSAVGSPVPDGRWPRAAPK